MTYIKEQYFMIMMKKIRAAAALLLMMCILCVSSGAVNIIGSSNAIFRSRIDSKIIAGADLSAEDAAMRLYYLGFLMGTGTDVNGGIEFNLSGGLNRLEAAVLAVRLLGVEKSLSEGKYPHPYSDVPEWASSYVGYLFRCGLLFGIDGEHFDPGSAETEARFMSYCLYALGYRIKDGDYNYATAVSSARRAGITKSTDQPSGPFTRGQAILAMYNTLRSTVKDATSAYSEKLVEREVIAYNDAIFLLWSKDLQETENYMSLVGYGNGWIIPDGYYVIKASRGGQSLNVACSGYNTDYDGVNVTLWQETSDVTQIFRLQRTERGTYYIYSAASRNGYGRVLGAPTWSDSVGLYTSTSLYAGEYVIRAAGDGNWVISTSEAGDTRCLTARDPETPGDNVVLDKYDGESMQTWEFVRQGVMNAQGEELAIFVANSMVITQGAYDVYSHMSQNAIDMQPTEGMARAPFNATVVHIDGNFEACNCVWIQSNNPVRYADGTVDYMTVSFMHDNDISDIYVGMQLAQGEYFYDCGTYGFAGGSHIHVCVFRGQFNEYTMHIGNGDVFIEDALFVPDNTYIYDSYGLAWNWISLAD